MARTIVLIHGAWLNSRSWEGFKARYEARGFTVLTPDWPYDDRTPAELREVFGDAWPEWPAEDFELTSQPIDFLGINYYTLRV